jgi:Cu/Ag efflux protein CusF
LEVPLIKPASKVAFVVVIALGVGYVTPPLRSQQTNLPPPSEQYPFASGTIERLDLGSKRLDIKTPKGARSFDVTIRTYIFRGKEKIALDKLKIGESIKLSYYTNELGQALVKRIKVDQPEPMTDSARQPEAPK